MSLSFGIMLKVDLSATVVRKSGEKGTVELRTGQKLSVTTTSQKGRKADFVIAEPAEGLEIGDELPDFPTDSIKVYLPEYLQYKAGGPEWVTRLEEATRREQAKRERRKRHNDP